MTFFRSSWNSRKNGRKSNVATLRREVFNKFKSSSQRSNSSQKLQDILKKAQFSKQSIFDNSDDSDAGENEKPPNFDCSGGLHLSDSNDSDEEHAAKPKKAVLALQKKNAEHTQSNDTGDEQGPSDLKAVHDNLQKMREIAEKLAGTSSKRVSSESQKENFNVADILAMGEAGTSKSKAKHKASQQDSDSDNWEDVEGKRKKIDQRKPSYVEFLKKYEYDE